MTNTKQTKLTDKRYNEIKAKPRRWRARMFRNDAERQDFSDRQGKEISADFEARGVVIRESNNLIDTVNGAIGR